MKPLIGRQPEIKELDRLLASKQPELLAVFGRRRIGKTFLIHRYLHDKGLYFEMTGIRGGSARQQIELFIQRIKEWMPSMTIDEMPKNWFQAFDVLREAIKTIKSKERIILFFDELPWMVTHKSDFLPAFETLWNSHLSRDPRILMVLCGSAVAWMIRKIIRNKGGLHGRLTAQMQLKPFSIKEANDYLISRRIILEKKQLAELYMVTGGIPKYLSFVEPGLSVPQTIQALCFSPQGRLTTEFLSLLESHFDKHKLHKSVIEALAEKKKGLTYAQIEKAAKIRSGGNLSKVLRELEATDFIQIVTQFGKRKKDSLYRLVDEYTLFYLNWVQKYLHGLKQSIGPHFWTQMHSSAEYRSWAGYAFENLILRHIPQLVHALDLTVVAKKASFWSIQPDGQIPGGQIDLVIERSDQCINLCEIKFYNAKYKTTKDYAIKLNTRREQFRDSLKGHKTLFNSLITPHGAEHNQHYLASVDQELTLDCLFL